jgi:FKBP-type peptidyl-prolyl cis-trans isomerase SlyD
MIVTKNRVVSIDYTLTDDHNNLLDSTSGQEPLDYLHGFENIIPGLEKALEGKSRGDRFSVKIPPAEAYGERDALLVQEIPLESFGGGEKPEPGMRFHAQSAEGTRIVTVTKVADNTVTVDANHPLAGMALTFDVTVTGIRDASGEELEHGHVHGHDHGGCCGGDCGGAEAGCGCGGH